MHFTFAHEELFLFTFSYSYVSNVSCEMMNLKCNTKRAPQSPYWHFNCNLISSTLQLSILFHSARHVQISGSNRCWQFLNTFFHSLKNPRRGTFKIQFIILALLKFSVSRKCSECRVVMSGPLVISDSCQSSRLTPSTYQLLGGRRRRTRNEVLLLCEKPH